MFVENPSWHADAPEWGPLHMCCLELRADDIYSMCLSAMSAWVLQPWYLLVFAEWFGYCGGRYSIQERCFFAL